MTSPIKQKADGRSQTPFLTMKNFSATPSDCPPIRALTPIPMKHPRETTRLVRQGNPLSWDDRPANSISIGDYMDRWNNQVNIGTAFPNSPTPRCRSFKTLLWIRKGIERTTLSELKTIRLQLGQGRLLLPGL